MPASIVELPEQFRLRHGLCQLLLNDINRIWEHILDHQRVSIDLAGRSELAAELDGLQGQAAWDVLASHGFERELREFSLRKSAAGLVHDFMLFVSHLLEASYHGHTAVTFALLRKPLYDNLLLLEWIVGDAPGFVQVLFEASARERDITSVARDRGLTIVRSCVARLRQQFPFTAEFLFEPRYGDRHAPLNLRAITDIAMHIVTSHSAFATDPGELNFIHSDDESRDSQWVYLYFILPVYLYYTAEVCGVLARDLGAELPVEGIHNLRRDAAFLHAYTSDPEALADLANELHHMPMPCPHCSESSPLSAVDLTQLAWHGSLRCPRCASEFSIADLARIAGHAAH